MILRKALSSVWIFVLVTTGCHRIFQGGPEGTERIRLSGNIELREVGIAFKTGGRILELHYDEGDQVPGEALIARLDPASLETEKERAQASLKALRSRGRELKALIAFQTANMEAQIQQRLADIRQAEAQLQRLLSGSRPEEIQESAAAVERASAEVRRAESDWARAQNLFQNEDISSSQFAQFTAAFESAKALLKQAEERHAIVFKGPRAEDIEQGRAARERAEAGLRQAEATALDIERNRRALETLHAEIEAAQAQLALVEVQLDDTYAYAPISGRVLVRSAEEGEVIAPGTSVLTLGDLDHPWVRGFIEERQLGRVKIGAPVQVRTDSYPGKTYQGHVSFVAAEAEFTPKQIQTAEERVKLVYRIKVDIENPAQELKLNMPVDAELLLGSPSR